MLASLFLTSACETESAPTPTPTPDVDDLLSMAGEKLAALTTAKFKLVDEMESGAKFFGTTFKRMEADGEGPRQLQDGSGTWSHRVLGSCRSKSSQLVTKRS